MANLYFSYQHADKAIVSRIAAALVKRGHHIALDDNVLKIGQIWRKVLLDSLKKADGVIVIITENSLRSNYVVSEIGTARAYIEESANKKFLLPIIYGDIPVPKFIDDIQCIRLSETDFEEIIDLLDSTISGYIGKIEAEKETIKKATQEVETKAADFINVITETLKTRESHNKLAAYLCYTLGAFSLIIGAAIVADGFKNFENVQNLLAKHPEQIWGIYTLAILKSVVIIGLIIAVSKYSFILGKSFMHESLRNADRIHTISFGEFYLKAFGDKISNLTEVKEIFQEWNIDKPSSFQNLDAKHFDPQMLENFIEAVKVVTKKSKSDE